MKPIHRGKKTPFVSPSHVVDSVAIDYYHGWNLDDLSNPFDGGRLFFSETMSAFFVTLLVALSRDFSGSVLIVSMIRGAIMAVSLATLHGENAGFGGHLGLSLPLCFSGVLYPRNRWAFAVYIAASIVGKLLAYLCVSILTLDLIAPLLGASNIVTGISVGVAFFAELVGGLCCILFVTIPLTLQFAYYKFNDRVTGNDDMIDPDTGKIIKTKQNAFNRFVPIIAPNTAFVGGLVFFVVTLAMFPITESNFDVLDYIIPKLIKAPDAFTRGDWIYPLAALLATFIGGSINYLFSWYFMGKYYLYGNNGIMDGDHKRMYERL